MEDCCRVTMPQLQPASQQQQQLSWGEEHSYGSVAGYSEEDSRRGGDDESGTLMAVGQQLFRQKTNARGNPAWGGLEEWQSTCTSRKIRMQDDFCRAGDSYLGESRSVMELVESRFRGSHLNLENCFRTEQHLQISEERGLVSDVLDEGIGTDTGFADTATSFGYDNENEFDWNLDQSRKTCAAQRLWRPVNDDHHATMSSAFDCAVVTESEHAGGHTVYSPSCEDFTVAEAAGSLCVPRLDYQVNDFPSATFGLRVPTFQERVASNDDCELDANCETLDCLMPDLRANFAPDAMSPCVKSRPYREGSNVPTRGPYLEGTVQFPWQQPAFAPTASISGHENYASQNLTSTSMTANTGLLAASAPGTFPSIELMPSGSFPRLAVQQYPVAQQVQAARMLPQYTGRIQAVNRERSDGEKQQISALRRLKFSGEEVPKSDPEAGQHRHKEERPECPLELRPLLLKCAAAVNSQEPTGQALLEQLKIFSSSSGDPNQRVAAVFSDALVQRLAKMNGLAVAASISPPSENLLENRVFNESCPYSKFVHLTANQAFLEAFEGSDSIHIIDVGIVHGVQWSALLQALVATPGAKPPLKIRITGIAPPNLGSDASAYLQATGKRLTDFAEVLGLKLEFCPVVERLQDLKLEMLQVCEGECVGINSVLQLHLLLGDSEEALSNVLKFMRSLQPKVLVLAEIEASTNVGEFLSRFSNVLHYCSAIFESLDATMPRECPDRAHLEKTVFAEEISNVVACEGPERTVRHEIFNQWSSILETSSFKCKPPSHYATSQARLLLWLFSDKFKLVRGSGSLSLGWMDSPLMTVSAWQCC